MGPMCCEDSFNAATATASVRPAAMRLAWSMLQEGASLKRHQIRHVL